MSVWGSSPLVVGHRGGRGDGWPLENSLDAFERARREGALAVELDVRTCAGGDAVVFHDETLSRVSSGRDARRVRDVPPAQLRAIGVPSLRDALEWARANDVGVNVEMKHDVPSRKVLARATVAEVRRSRADVLLSSFDPWLLAIAGAMAPEVPRALLVHRGQPAAADVLQRLVAPPVVRAIHLERTQADAHTVTRHLRRGLRVGVWTVNEPSEAASLLRLGVASIITDSPGVILGALAAHSQSTSSAANPGGTG